MQHLLPSRLDLLVSGLDSNQLQASAALPLGRLFCFSQSLSRAYACLVPQGLFRLAAAASVVKRLKTCLDQGAVDHSDFSMDPHAVAGNDPVGMSSFYILAGSPLNQTV